MIVAIDGPAGSGKSTVAHEVARRRGLVYLDTGAMYRSVTFAALDRGLDLNDEAAVTALAHEVEITFGGTVDAQRTFVQGQDVTEEIRTPEIDRNVSQVSAYPGVREAMVQQQRAIAATGDVIAEGRDIGTVVFPDADVKVFLTADAAARAHRRAVQRTGQDAAKDPSATADADDEAQILADIKRRDQIDSTREVAPLKAAEDAVHIDSSNLTVDEVCAQIEALMDAAAAPVAEPTPEAPAAEPEPEAPAVEPAPEPEAPAAEPAPTPDPRPASPSAATKERLESKVATARKVVHAKADHTGPMSLFGNDREAYFAHSMSEYPVTTKAFYAVVVAAVTGFTKLMWRWEIEDEDKLYPEPGERGVVVIGNHVSMLDPLTVIPAFFWHGQRLRPIYKSEFDDNPLMRWFLPRMGGIPVKRGTADMSAVRQAQRALESGDSILIYPEGTRVKPGEPSEIHGGFALIASMGKADIIPTAIIGAANITPRGSHIPRPGKVWVRVGDAISSKVEKGKGRKKKLRELEERAMREVWALLDILRLEHPGKE